MEGRKKSKLKLSRNGHGRVTRTKIKKERADLNGQIFYSR